MQQHPKRTTVRARALTAAALVLLCAGTTGSVTAAAATAPVQETSTSSPTTPATTADQVDHASHASHTPNDATAPASIRPDTGADVRLVIEPALILSPEEIAQLPEYRIDPDEIFPISGDPETGSYPADPNDPEHVTIYLDFLGETVQNTFWNTEFDIEVAEMSGAQLADPLHNPDAHSYVHQIWASVAEDYAPFDVNVTTTAPHPDDLIKSSPDDRRFGVHVVITDTYTDIGTNPPAGGLAYTFSAGDPFHSPAFVFTTGMGSGDPTQATAKLVAEGASHEAGHTLGLNHHGLFAEEYFYPNQGIWAPTMGAAYSVPLSQWSAGEYTGASRPYQNDIQLLTDRSNETMLPRSVTTADGTSYDGPLCPAGPIEYGATYTAEDPITGCTGSETGEPVTVQWSFTGVLSPRPDTDTPGSAATPTPVGLSATPATVTSVIRSASDEHRYRFTTSGGQFTANLDVVDHAPNLNAALTLTRSDGSVVAHDDPAVTQQPDATRPDTLILSGLGADLSLTLSPGTYTLSVRGSGQGDPLSPEFAWWAPEAFTATGSTGNYRLVAQLSEPEPAPSPAPEPAPEPAPQPAPTPGGGSAPNAATPPAHSAAAHEALPNTGAPFPAGAWVTLALTLTVAGCSVFAAARHRVRGEAELPGLPFDA